MRVRMKVNATTPSGGWGLCLAGEEYDLPEALAALWAGHGYCVAADSVPPVEEVETPGGDAVSSESEE